MAISRTDAGPKQQRTTPFRPGIIETVWPVRITIADVQGAIAEAERIGGWTIWLADATWATSFEAAVIGVAGAELARLKKTGLQRIVAVIPSVAVRMAARAVSLASGMEIRVVDRRLEA